MVGFFSRYWDIVVQSLSMFHYLQFHGLQHSSTSGFPVFCCLPKFAQTHVHWAAIQSSHSLSPLLLLISIFSSIRVFYSELAICIRWSKYWSFRFSISPSNEYSGLIFFRIDWFHLLAVQEDLKSLLQHHNSKASILQHPAMFMVQVSHPYMTTVKTIALTLWIFVGKVMSLLFNTPPMFVMAFLFMKQVS